MDPNCYIEVITYGTHHMETRLGYAVALVSSRTLLFVLSRFMNMGAACKICECPKLRTIASYTKGFHLLLACIDFNMGFIWSKWVFPLATVPNLMTNTDLRVNLSKTYVGTSYSADTGVKS